MPWEIGRLTPGELRDIVLARSEHESRGRIEIAWMTALFSRQKKLPSLERLLAPASRRQALKTPEQRKTEYEELVERLGK